MYDVYSMVSYEGIDLPCINESQTKYSYSQLGKSVVGKSEFLILQEPIRVFGFAADIWIAICFFCMYSACFEFVCSAMVSANGK